MGGSGGGGTSAGGGGTGAGVPDAPGAQPDVLVGGSGGGGTGGGLGGSAGGRDAGVADAPSAQPDVPTAGSGGAGTGGGLGGSAGGRDAGVPDAPGAQSDVPAAGSGGGASGSPGVGGTRTGGITGGSVTGGGTPSGGSDGGGSQPFSTSGEVGPSGGGLEVKGSSSALEGAAIQVPAGALSTPITLTISTSQGPLQPPLPANSIVAGPVVALGPDGTTFDTPVFVTFPYQPLDGIDDSDLQVVISDGLAWHAAPVLQRDPDKHQITVAVLHFSDGVVIGPGPTPAASKFDPSLDGFGFLDAAGRCAGIVCFAKCFYDTRKPVMKTLLSQYASATRRQEIATDAQNLLKAQEDSWDSVALQLAGMRATDPSKSDWQLLVSHQPAVVKDVRAAVSAEHLVHLSLRGGNLSQDGSHFEIIEKHALLVYSCPSGADYCRAYDPQIGDVKLAIAESGFTTASDAVSGEVVDDLTLSIYYLPSAACDCRAMNVADVAGTWNVNVTVAGQTKLFPSRIDPKRVKPQGYSLSFGITKDQTCGPSPFDTSTPLSGLEWPMKPVFTSTNDVWVLVNGTIRSCFYCNGEINGEFADGLNLNGTYAGASCIPNTTQSVTGTLVGTRN